MMELPSQILTLDKSPPAKNNCTFNCIGATPYRHLESILLRKPSSIGLSQDQNWSTLNDAISVCTEFESAKIASSASRIVNALLRCATVTFAMPLAQVLNCFLSSYGLDSKSSFPISSNFVCNPCGNLHLMRCPVSLQLMRLHP